MTVQQRRTARRFGPAAAAGARCACVVLVWWGCGLSARGADPAEKDERTNPFGCLDAAAKLGDKFKLEDLRIVAESKQRQLESIECTAGGGLAAMPGSYLFLAELMKRTGDYRAYDYYRKAICAAPDEPAYDLFLADYLRIFRGAGRPQFPQAEFHYQETRRKLRGRRVPAEWDKETAGRLERDLVALYQEDGLPLAGEPIGDDQLRVYPFWPHLFFSSINTLADATTDLPKVDDVRDFTSEAMLAHTRLSRDLSPDELRSFAREKPQFETTERFRFRYHDAPVLDVTYRYDTIGSGQLKNFYTPGKFNNVTVDEFGAALSGPMMVAGSFDMYWRAGYRSIARTGVVEWLPHLTEQINQCEGTLAASRFIGPDKVSVEAVAAYQDISPKIGDIPVRDRLITAVTGRYQLFRRLGSSGNSLGNQFDRRFDTRGIELFGGVLWDQEAFGSVDLVRHDYFGGVAVRGFKIEPLQDWFRSFDLTVQSTVFDSGLDVSSDQDNAQYRTTIALLGRILDEEETTTIPADGGPNHLAFVHLVVPFKHDLALNGDDHFENVAAGLQLHAKWYNTRLHGASWLGSAGYTYQNFYRLDKDLHLFAMNLGLGF